MVRSARRRAYVYWVLMGVTQGDGQRRLVGRAMKVGGGDVRVTCGVGMRSKEWCAGMAAQPLMQRGGMSRQ